MRNALIGAMLVMLNAFIVTASSAAGPQVKTAHGVVEGTTEAQWPRPSDGSGGVAMFSRALDLGELLQEDVEAL